MALTLMMRSGLEIKMTTAKFPNDCDNCIYIGLFQHYIKERGFRREDTGEFVEHGITLIIKINQNRNQFLL